MLYEKKKKDTFVAENAGNPLGEMLEWLKRLSLIHISEPTRP